jgi:hypothetical protein
MTSNAIHRFESCSICLGYCHDSARVEVAETFEPDLEAIFHLCGESDPERAEKLGDLLRSEHEWVRYYAAITLARHDAFDPAVAALQGLRAGKDGLPGLFAAAALSHLAKEQAG